MMLLSPAALLPLLILAVTSVILVLMSAFIRNGSASGWTAFAGIVLSLLSAAASLSEPALSAGTLFAADPSVRYFLCLALACGATVILLAISYPDPRGAKHGELFTVLVTGTLGAGAIICSSHFSSFFIGLEVLSVSIFVLCGYFCSRPGLEAAFKYLVLSSSSTAFLLFGIALLYFQMGTLELNAILHNPPPDDRIFEAGLALVAVGAAFKIAVVPFHMWTADVYQGAPAPVSAFIATVSKAALFAFVLRHLSTAGNHQFPRLSTVITVAAIASMFLGNILGLLQNNLKRLLAYSSVAQAGYVLVAFQAGGKMAVQAASIYLGVYFLSILGAFGVISLLGRDGRELDELEDYRGLAFRRPLMALVLAAMFFSLAGIPATAGFVGKFYLFSAGVDSSLWLLLICLAGSSVIGLFYYLRVIVTLYTPAEHRLPGTVTCSALASLVLGALTVLVLLFGIFPSPLIRLVEF